MPRIPYYGPLAGDVTYVDISDEIRCSWQHPSYGYCARNVDHELPHKVIDWTGRIKRVPDHVEHEEA